MNERVLCKDSALCSDRSEYTISSRRNENEGKIEEEGGGEEEEEEEDEKEAECSSISGSRKCAISGVQSPSRSNSRLMQGRKSVACQLRLSIPKLPLVPHSTVILRILPTYILYHPYWILSSMSFILSQAPIIVDIVDHDRTNCFRDANKPAAC